MKVTFDCPDKINGLMTIVIEPADYQEKVEKTLKDYRKKAQVPGFRPGQVPMGMIKRQYGTAVKVEEVNRLISEKLYGYIQENKIVREKYLTTSFVLRKKDFQLLEEDRKAKEEAEALI